MALDKDYTAAPIQHSERELWHFFRCAVDRRDLFWCFFYADQLSTLYTAEKAARLLPVIELDS